MQNTNALSGSLSLAIVCVALVFSAAAIADPQAVDTSEWKCTQCPFSNGSDVASEVGLMHASGANAYFGRYTGVDHGGAYAEVNSSGRFREDSTYANYDVERLGLASREGAFQLGREGHYDVRISYDGQPDRLYNGPVRIETDRRTVALLGRFFANPSWTLFGEFRRQEKQGTGLTAASFLTEAVQLTQPINYVTNSFETGAAWAGRSASFRLSYLGSWFSNSDDALNFNNPYAPIVPGSNTGRLGQPPSNLLQQVTAAGNVQLPYLASILSYTGSLGTLRQNDSFLPDSTIPGAIAPASGSLDGNVRLSHYALGLAARPLSRLNIRGNATYDGRNDKTAPIAIAYVVTDTFAGGTAVTPRYSEDRVRLDGGADYSVLHWLKLGVGGKFDDNHYGPGQVVRNTQNAESWGVATLVPRASVILTLKIGNALRKASSFQVSALPVDENPLIRFYNYAPRDRVFSRFTGSWSATPTLIWTAEAYLAKDDYRSSPLGLLGVHEQRTSTTLSWTPRDTLSAYVDAGYQRLFTLQNGFSGVAVTPWLASDTERFVNVGVGGRWVPQERWTLNIDYTHAPSYGDNNSTVGGLQQIFPQNRSKLDSTHLDVMYGWTPSLQLHFRVTRETYKSADWALDGVGTFTVPNYLALGLQPYRDNVNVFELTARYQFGSSDGGAHPTP